MNSKKLKISFVLIVISIFTSFVISICVGKYPITLDDIKNLILGNSINEMSRKVFFTLRLPRTIMTLTAGFGLGMAGSVYQTIFRNPLASPDIIGVSSGANLGAAVAIIFVGNQINLVAGSAFIGGLMAVYAVTLLVHVTQNNSTATYVLAGIVIASLSQSIIMVLKFFADPESELAAIEFWSMGSFGSVTDLKLQVVLPIILLGIIVVILFRRQIFLLALNEDESRMLGVRVTLIRVIILSFTTLVVAAIVSITGLIAFIGLIAPHIGKLILKRQNFTTCIFSACVGSIIMMLADCLARTLYTAELPISILTTFLGVPFLIYFMYHKKEEQI
ncbi:iron ABC transporter permease [Clostridium sp. PL3]|uniref:Iron ABC transporter permease n=1 Tax=Clostridium thailandense TaxID=2794346 RepID=A0A949U509_9CLOT|nr:iron ABC transporter permease [Clostridium thailandense]MBV7276613.1 iron ABC transporter permease [Clostridium thailandense]